MSDLGVDGRPTVDLQEVSLEVLVKQDVVAWRRGQLWRTKETSPRSLYELYLVLLPDLLASSLRSPRPEMIDFITTS